MRIFKTKWFHKWAKKERLTDDTLSNAVGEMEHGMIDANLGGHVYKKRVAIWGRGKSGGLRSIIAYQVENKAFYMYGFAKNKRANISDRELKVFQLLAQELLDHDDQILNHLVAVDELVEILSDE